MAKPPGKSEETFKNKIKSILGFKQSTVHNVSVRPQTKEIIFTSELLREIRPESPANHRLKTIRELCDIVATRRLEENATETLWQSVCDLLHPQVPVESRHVALRFLQCLIKGQYVKLGTIRAHFFRVIRQHNLYEDLPLRLEVFITLTENGKDLTYIEEETGQFLLHWMSDVINSGKVADFLGLLVNVIKYNAAYLEPETVAGLVQYTCTVSNRTKVEEDLQMCIQVFNAVVCYSYLPSEALHNFITSLCRLVNLDRFCQASWKLMKNLLGTHLGHSGIYTMCRILQNRENASDYRLLRGAVFFIGMAMWGSKRVSTLKHPHSTVLPCFLQALHNCTHVTVVYEVVLSIQRLVKKYGTDIQFIQWQIILDIIETLLSHFEACPTEQTATVQQIFHEILTTLEQLYENGVFNGDHERLFTVVEKCANRRPESSVLVLISYKAQAIHPAKANWIQNLNHLVEKYFKDEMRTKIRAKALAVLSCVLSANRHLYEDELIHIVVLPHLAFIDNDPDVDIRNNAVQLLLDLAQGCQSQRCADILDILERVVNRSLSDTVSIPHTGPQEQNQDYTHIAVDEDFCDIKTAALGLVDMFKTKLFQLPSTHASKIYELLLNILRTHYREKYMSKTACSIREAVFRCLLELRADTMHRLGIRRKDGEYCYSSYILCDSSLFMALLTEPIRNDHVEKRISVTSPPQQVTPTPSPVSQLKQAVIPYSEAFLVILTSLEQELDWPVLMLVLEQLPLVLRNKSLILSSQSSIQRLCTRLCDMVSDKGMLRRLQNTPTGFIMLDFHTYFFPPLTGLSLYHMALDKKHKMQLIRCLEFGLISRCAKVSISAMTVCMLEMQDTMMRQIPSVLLKLSKTSSTVSVASPKLEFLSSLIRLPKLYTNFVEEQYMSIFAIALPYTNPFKFGHYTVSLAHHLIAMWFLKCRLPFRKTFVTYINRNLRANVLNQFEETAKLNLAMMNQDSSDRRRLRSVGESSYKRKPMRPVSVAGHMAGQRQDSEPQFPNEEMSTFHKELTETCLDMMARYTFSSCSSMPKRSPVTEFLLKGGQSQSWLVGNKVVTVTTSGGGSRVGKGGLCEKCVSLYKGSSQDEKESKEKEREDAHKVGVSCEDSQKQCLASKRRRHKSAAVKSVTVSDIGLQKQTSKDDIQLCRGLPDEAEAVSATSSPSSVKSRSPYQSTVALSVDKEEDVNDMLLGWKKKESERINTHHCNCWCQGWAEVYIRRPTGNISWMMRIQNDQFIPMMMQDFPLDDISTLFRGGNSDEFVDGHKRIDSESLGENEYESLFDEHFQVIETKSQRALRRQFTANDPFDPGQLDMDLHDDVYTYGPKSSFCMDALSTTVESEDHQRSQREDVQQDMKASSVGKRGSFPSLRKTHSSPDIGNDYAQFMKDELKADELSLSGDHGNRGKADDADGPKTEVAKSEGAVVAQTLEAFEKSEEKLFERKKSRHKSEGSRLGSRPLGPEDENDEDIAVLHPNEERRVRHSPFVDVETKQEVTAEEVPEKKDSDSGTELSDVHTRELADEVTDLQSVVMRRNKPRGHTIAVVPSAMERTRSDSEENKRMSMHMKEMYRTGLTPSFVFLMLYHSPGCGLGEERPLVLPQTPSCWDGEDHDFMRPLLLPGSPVIDRAVKVLDHIPPYETHKIGVLYVGTGQASDETAILSNAYGSSRYAEFLNGLGELLRLKDCSVEQTYVGGLDLDGDDGKFTYCWQDDVMQVIFHVATLMPAKESDPNCNAKKLHIGNDYVTIVYNNSNEDYKIGTIKGQFNYVNIIITPLDYGSNAVSVSAREDILELIGQSETKIISDARLPILTRQMALHSNLASMILQRQKTEQKDPYASNWLERLRQIKRIRQKVQEETSHLRDEDSNQKSHHNYPEDFTDFV
ncbi:tuberin-like isoform X3 [Lineus longissimus]|uniref:tuberin-like isoform X3 n=1 Tax=Lineus longissimus TaxID=88925 RepID=UPI00315CABDC